MRTLGVDPGSRATGYGVLELEGRSLRLLASGVIRPGEGPLAQRLSCIHAGLLDLIALWKPQQVALEAVFVAVLGTLAPEPRLLAAVLAYRAAYYLFPLLLALAFYAAFEARRGRSPFTAKRGR